ncbi:MAG TPA: zinc-ribbon domain-containing protein [Methanoregulaceae archaeon]|nr:zinc-ribbon domain-containing protein [Methanoregulaceae archaeon]HPD10055.1 zinc-ribbon domain-containing protein [Methanoregulaceae archaeon]HRT15061.1 zinc-ribbon domain-containing protein [Methanoregulaceae archaeon]HRU30632.1 zinc-ribbon domain-containing protein [Methanoregulaceae archaeon]
MDTTQFDAQDPAVAEEPVGAERYLYPGEELRVCSSDIQIKKFMFEAYLTNRRFFLIDQIDRNSGVTAKEIPVDAILSSYLEESPLHEPVIVLSVRTADDDIRLMKMTFVHIGREREPEAEEWVHLLAHAAPGTTESTVQGPAERAGKTASIPPETRALSDTIVLPYQADSRYGEQAYPAPSREITLAPAPSAPKPLPDGSPEQKETAVIMFCFHCGKKLPPMANFCPFCGTRVHTRHEDVPFQEGHIPPPPQRSREPEPEEPQKKRGWRRFFVRER